MNESSITLSSTPAHALLIRCIKSFTSCTFWTLDSLLNYDIIIIYCSHLDWGQGCSAATNLEVYRGDHDLWDYCTFRVKAASNAQSYIADELHHPAESEFRRRLRSASLHELSVPRTQLSTYGDRTFPVAAVRIWNSLPQHVTSATSLPVFCTRLKTYFFELCYS